MKRIQAIVIILFMLIIAQDLQHDNSKSLSTSDITGLSRFSAVGVKSTFKTSTNLGSHCCSHTCWKSACISFSVHVTKSSKVNLGFVKESARLYQGSIL